MGQDEQNEWMSTDAASGYLGVSAATLYRLVDQGLLAAYRPSRSLRFRRADLDAYLEAVRVQPGDLTHLRADEAGRQVRDTKRTDRSHEPT
jgi:excisionase family DNA binding protein